MIILLDDEQFLSENKYLSQFFFRDFFMSSEPNCIKDTKYKKTAIITDNIDSAKKLYKELDDNNIQLIDFNTDSFTKDIFIIPSYLSKGLEFEYVIIYKENEYKNRKLYYVALTRAQHKLTILE